STSPRRRASTASRLESRDGANRSCADVFVASRNSSRYPGSMLNRDYEGQDCSVARTLELVGERWTLLIVRDAFLGRRRFEEFQESLGIARNILTDRLAKLVDHDVFERVRYQERPE